MKTKATLPNSFYMATVTMILKPHKAQTKKITNIDAKLKKTLNYANNMICWKSKNVKLNK